MVISTHFGVDIPMYRCGRPGVDREDSLMFTTIHIRGFVLMHREVQMYECIDLLFILYVYTYIHL